MGQLTPQAASILADVEREADILDRIERLEAHLRLMRATLDQLLVYQEAAGMGEAVS